jgi:hypothetical protein
VTTGIVLSGKRSLGRRFGISVLQEKLSVEINFDSLLFEQESGYYKAVVPKLFEPPAPLGSINLTPVHHALRYIKHSSEQRFAHPSKEDNNNKKFSNCFAVSKFLMRWMGLMK